MSRSVLDGPPRMRRVLCRKCGAAFSYEFKWSRPRELCDVCRKPAAKWSSLHCNRETMERLHELAELKGLPMSALLEAWVTDALRTARAKRDARMAREADE